MQKIYNIFADITPYSHYSRRNTLDRRIDTGQELFTHQHSDSEGYKDEGALVWGNIYMIGFVTWK